MTNLEEYLANLGSPDETERTYAAEDLGYLNVPEAVPPLLERLQAEPSITVRDAIFQALSRMDGAASTEGAVQLLESDDPQIRNQAVIVLRGKGARAVPLLSTVIQTGNRHLRKLALDALSGVQSGDAAEVCAAALSDPDPNVVITAVENLGRIRATEFLSRIEELLQADSQPMLTAACLEALVGIGEESSLGAIRCRFPNLAAVPDFLFAPCLKAMSAVGSEREFSEIASLLPVRGHHLRPAIIGALKGIHSRCRLAAPDDNLVSALRAVIENGDPPLCRYQAVQALGLWSDREDIRAYILSCLTNGERMIRLAAAESLRAANRPELDPVLAARALEEPDEEILQALTC